MHVHKKYCLMQKKRFQIPFAWSLALLECSIRSSSCVLSLCVHVWAHAAYLSGLPVGNLLWEVVYINRTASYFRSWASLSLQEVFVFYGNVMQWPVVLLLTFSTSNCCLLKVILLLHIQTKRCTVKPVCVCCIEKQLL